MPSFRRFAARAMNPALKDTQPSRRGRFIESEGGLTWTVTGGDTIGPEINSETALTVSAMYRATVLVASTIAAFPRRIYIDRPGEAPQPVRDPNEAALWRRPNPEVSAMEFWETVIGHEFLDGNAFMYVVKNGAGHTVELWPILPERVRIYRAKSTGQKFYTLDGDNETPYADATAGGEICHVAGFGRDGMRGLSLVQLMSQALSLAKASEQYSARTFENGTHLAGVLETDQALEQEDAEKLSARWHKYNSGLRNAQKTAVMDHGLKWKPISVTPADAQLIEARKFQVLDVARFTGVPGYMLDPSVASSWGTGIAEQNQGFGTYTIATHKNRFDTTITDELLVYPERRFEFDSGHLFRGNLRDQVAAVESLIRAGFEPAAALNAVGMAPITHTGLRPVTVAPEEPAQP